MRWIVGWCLVLFAAGAMAEASHSEFPEAKHVPAQTEWAQRLKSLEPLVEPLKPLKPAGQGYYRTGYGLLINQNCLNKIDGEELNQLGREAYRDGISCLWKLGTSSARDNVNRMAALFARTDRPPKLNCPNDGEDDMLNYSYAHSTTNAGEPGHPSIFLGVDSIPGIDKKPLPLETKGFLRSTLFHESIHNLGYGHGVSIEYPFACETCCFTAETKSETEKQLACQICRGGYTGMQDPRYLADISEYADLEHSILGDTRNQLAAHVLQHPHDANARALWAVMGKSDSLKVAIAQAIGENNPRLQPRERSMMKSSLALAEPRSQLKALSEARDLVTAYFDLLEGKPGPASRSLALYHIPKAAETPEIYWLEYFRQDVVGGALDAYLKKHPRNADTEKISKLIKILFP